MRTIRTMSLLVGSMLLACSSDENPAGVGNHCQRDSDCTTKSCYLGPGGGYCTSPCDLEGDTAACPPDTVCKPIQGGARRCLIICGSDSTCGKDQCTMDFCPSGSSCVSVSSTTSRACEPNPG